MKLQSEPWLLAPQSELLSIRMHRSLSILVEEREGFLGREAAQAELGDRTLHQTCRTTNSLGQLQSEGKRGEGGQQDWGGRLGGCWILEGLEFPLQAFGLIPEALTGEDREAAQRAAQKGQCIRFAL